VHTPDAKNYNKLILSYKNHTLECKYKTTSVGEKPQTFNIANTKAHQRTLSWTLKYVS